MKTQLVLYSIDSKTKFLHTLFSNDDKLSELDLLTGEMHCHEVLTWKGKELVKKWYNENPSF